MAALRAAMARMSWVMSSLLTIRFQLRLTHQPMLLALPHWLYHIPCWHLQWPQSYCKQLYTISPLAFGGWHFRFARAKFTIGCRFRGGRLWFRGRDTGDLLWD